MKLFGRKSIFMLLSVALLWGVTAVSASAAQTRINVQVDGKNVSFPDAKPYVEDSRVMIPVRFVSESLGAKVDYKKETSGSRVNRVVKITLGSKLISMNVNADKVLVDDSIITLDVPARVQQKRVYVPLRFVSEALGAKVDWKSAKKLVNISTGKPVTNPDPVPSDSNMYSTNFEWDKDSSGYVYNKLAKELFVNNMKVSNGKLTFTLPREAEADYMTAKGAITHLTPGKTYTYSIGQGQGSIEFALVYPGRDEQEAYSVFLNSKINKDADELFGQYNDAIVIVGGNSSGAPLSEVQKIAQKLK
ncbi:copper amine oxidase N-terminal domain-containing protein [Paenibacillus puldeungensis]|uniref:Copper amine oxidase N-terminal domain-containing protein n=1 Tax=Paenibacillus puldeungensis TaxID=696536 RepID=A0ABW3S4Z2_9BACL